MKHIAEIIFLIFLFVPFSGLTGRDVIIDPRTNKPARYAGDLLAKPDVSVPKKPVFRKDMFRGVWVATVENIDFSKTGSADEFRKNFIELVNRLKSIHATAVIFQIRPMNDAFYPSELNPWSRFMTGKEGGNFGKFDPLSFMIRECHKRNIEFHAWLNPYRVMHNVKKSTGAALQELTKKNYARLHPDQVLNVPGNNGQRLLILDPGHPEVQYFLLSTVREIVMEYDVDAIHFDDYFYPYEGTGNADSATYQKYNPGKLSIEDWRRNNVTLMIASVSRMIRTINVQQKRNVKFGISPFGIWANQKRMKQGSLTGGSESYFKQYADTRLWVKSGYLDYIAPQLYWTFGHNTAPYAHLTDWWANTVRGTKTKLYIGHSVARLGENQEWSNPLEIYNQMRYNTMLPNVHGSILYSYSKLFFPLNATMKKGGTKAADVWKSLP